MHDALQQWIAENLRQPGIRAFGVRLPDKTCFSHTFTSEFEEARLDRTWQDLAETVTSFMQNRIAATRLRWAYEYGHLHYVIRPDGTALGLLTSASPLEADPAMIERVLGDFLAFAAA